MKRKNLSQRRKQMAFREMAKCFKEWSSDNPLGAYVLAFSFLEDRLTAMYIVRGNRIGDVEIRSKDDICHKTKMLWWAGDIDVDLVKSIISESKSRNHVVHGAMWNKSVYSGRASNRAFDLARRVDAARKRQRRRLGI